MEFKCLRCGFTYTATLKSSPELQERVCPRCKSNSVRKLPPK